MRVVGYVLGSIVVVVAIVVAVSVIATGSLFFAAEVKEAQRPAQEKLLVQDAASALQKYEEFYDNCNDVIRLTRSIEIGEDEVRGLERSTVKVDPDSLSAYQQQSALNDARADVAALQDQREQVVKEYNASSSKAKTRSLFKANDLPFRIEPPYENVNCGGA